MSCSTKNIKFQLRRDTALNWFNSNPRLLAGEPGYDTTNHILKIGDGSTLWNLLPSINSSGPTGPTGPNSGVTGPTGADSHVTGPTGARGLAFFYGTDGPTGAYTGTNPPPQIGDIFINTTTGGLYMKFA